MALPDDVESVGDVEAWQWDGRTLRLRCRGGAQLEVAAWAPDLIRVVMAPPGVPPTVGWALARGPESFPGDFPLRFAEKPQAFLVATPRVQIRVSRPRPAISFEVNGHPLPVAEDDPDGSMGTRGESVWLVKRLRPRQRCFGLGEKTGWLDRRERSLVMWNTDVLPHLPDTDPLYQAIPFLIVEEEGRFFGLFVHNTHRLRFDLGKSHPERLVISADGGQLDYFFLAGPSLAEVVGRYTDLTGRMPLPPRWALGFHQSRWGYASAEEVREVARTLRSRRIPCDAIYLDIDYMDGYRVFTWDPRRFPDAAGLIRELGEQGFRVVTIVDPGVKVDEQYPVYRDGRQRGYFCRTASGEIFQGRVWPGDCVWPDFTRVEVRRWWAEQHEALLAAGVSGIWNDMNEPANFREGLPTGTLEPTVVHGPDTERAPDQQRRVWHAEAHNVYGMLMSQAAYEAQLRRHPQRRPFVLTRAGFAGIQRYAAVWSGDNASWWEHLTMMVPQLINMGLSGLALVGADVGGFMGDCTGELLARWSQAGALIPFFRNHASIHSRRQEVWAFGEEVEAICRRYIELRYRLLPYLYALAWEACATGAPILRPLFWHYPEDPAAYRVQDEFMVGPHLLVAPVTQPSADHRLVYLPEGEWVHLLKPLSLHGPAYHPVFAPLEELPVWVRAGAPLPMGPVVQHTGELARHAPLMIRVALPRSGAAGAAHTLLYEDDGETFAYRQGVYAKRRVESRFSREKVQLTVSSREGSFRPVRAVWDAVFDPAPGPPKAVRLNGRSLTPAAGPIEPLHGDGADGFRGWYHDGPAARLVVRVPEAADEQTLEVEWFE